MSKSPSGAGNSPVSPLSFTVPVNEYRSLPIPGLSGTKVGDCFVAVTDLPEELERFMSVNPRVPSRRQNGVLSGPVVKGINETLLDSPEDMAIKNQGIYLLVDGASFSKQAGGKGELQVSLTDSTRHGIVNGGHTFAAIRDAIEKASVDELKSLSTAYVRLHILEGLEASKVAEIAEGLNRSKQVDDPSLVNLQGHFDQIRQAMSGKSGAEEIAYHQGLDGELYVTEVLVFLEMFNRERFDRKRHPHNLYSRTKSALEFYQRDLEASPSPVALLVPRLPDILSLSDLIKQETPAAAKRVGFEFGRMKTGKVRAGTKTSKDIKLPFLGTTMSYRVPKGWLYPMLAAFRANADWDLKKGLFSWKIPLDKLVKHVIDDLVRVCVTEHRDNNLQPDKVGKRESTYVQCYDKVQLYLLEHGVAAP